MSHNIKNKGFTLIELIIAIFILAVAIIGVYNSFSTVVIFTDGASSRLTAAYLAQEGIEIVRNMRDNNWLNSGQGWKKGLSSCSTGCEADYKTGTLNDARGGLTSFGSSGNYLNIKNNNFYSYDNIDSTPTKFKRKITITTPDPLRPVLKVSVLVTWKEKEEEGCNYGYCIEAEEYLYNWY